MAKKTTDKAADTNDALKALTASPLKMVSRVLHGQVVSVDFFMRHWLLILVGLVFIMIYITNKYNCQTGMEEIQQLKKELEVVRTERIREKSAYMSKLTEQSMQARLDSMHLNLTVQSNPPFHLPAKK